MTRPIRDALLEWIAGMMVGAVPLLGHLAIWTTARPGVGDPGDWAVDCLFVAITASGTSVVTAVIRIIKKLIPQSALSLPLGLLIAINTVLMVPEATIYGNIVSGQARPGSLWAALAMLGASAFSAMVFELAIANRTEHDGGAPAETA